MALATNEADPVFNLKSRVADIEFEVAAEKSAEELGMNLAMLRESVDDGLLTTISSVADLMIIDRKVLQNYCGEGVLEDLIKVVSCPVLVLPENRKVDSLIMLHDGSLSSVQSVKQFISIFNTELRTLPVSVLVSDPESNQAIEAEKVFIDYIKLFFKDIGIQLMYDDPIECLIRLIENTTDHPMVIAGEIGGNRLLNCNAKNRVVTDSAPTFIFKNHH